MIQSTETDRHALRYIAQNPGLSEEAASFALRAPRPQIESLIERGFVRLLGIREEGLPRGLYLTAEGWRALGPLERHELDMRLLLYIAENPGCKRGEAVAAGDNLTRLDQSEVEYRRLRVNDFILHGLVRAEGEPNRARLHLTEKGRAYLFAAA